MVHGLLGGQSTHGGHNTKGITSEEDNILGVTTDGRDSYVLDVLQGVADTRVASQGGVLVVDSAHPVGVLVVLAVLEQSTEFYGIKNIWLLLSGQAVALSVTTTLNVEHIIICPDVLIVSNEGTLGIRGQSGLTSAGKTKQDSSVAITADVGGAMHAKVVDLGHVVVHNTKDTLLHFAGVGGAENDLFLRGEVDVHGVLACNIGDLRVRAELTSVHDGEVGAGLIVSLDPLLGSSDKHLLHEEGMVRLSANDSSLQLEAGVPTSVLVNDEDSTLHVQEINGS